MAARFIVCRASGPSDKIAPCEEAQCEIREYQSSRDTRDTENVWFVDIASLDELLAFYGRYGAIIIRDSVRYPELEIEIYDDYIE